MIAQQLGAVGELDALFLGPGLERLVAGRDQGPDEALPILRQLLDVPTDKNAALASDKAA